MTDHQDAPDFRAVMIAQLRQQLADAEARVTALETVLARIIPILPEAPTWNGQGVLVWSLLDAEYVQQLFGKVTP